MGSPSALSTLWQVLPEGVLHFLGRKATHAVWERHLPLNPVAELQPNWQVLSEGASQDMGEWGLQSVTLQTEADESAWVGPWPEGLPGAKVNLAMANQFFGEPLIQDRTIALYQIQSPQDHGWVAQCLFDEHGRLESLTLVKMHDWLPLEEATAEGKGTADDVTVEPVLRAAAGSRAQRAGWYEATLPASHPMQKYFANSETRLVFRKETEVFPTLGVTPKTDEALVEWVWIRAE
ncbi:hypothetical protein SDC9_68906 [bioreactor metagenome]|uniref:Uncharacterized protein n=1 Tax=bioreactor metagenome TaxID=1076179 RepID=A0A644Y3F5_9ZZZZ